MDEKKPSVGSWIIFIIVVILVVGFMLLEIAGID